MSLYRLLFVSAALFLGLVQIRADDKQQLTTPTESIAGMRPGVVTVDKLSTHYGKPAVVTRNGLLGLYGGEKESEVYGWFMVANPNYTVPDLAVETAQGSDRIDLVMAIGYDGFKTERGIACFATEDDLIKAYGKPDFAFAVPLNGFVLHEWYYIKLGISFDLAPTGPTPDRSVIAIYVTYPEFLERAVDIRKQYIKNGIGHDVTFSYSGGQQT